MAVKPNRMQPHFEEIQAHYDLSDDFFGLFQDPTRTYSCAYFARDDMTLEEAQIAKVDLNLDKLDLKPGMTLLDIGCGWGATMKRAMEKYDVNVIGLTLSKNQHAYCSQLLDTVRHRPLAPGAAARLGAVQRPRRPHRVHRGVRALRVRALRRLLQERLQHPARRRPDDDPEQHRVPPRRLPTRGKKLTFELARFIKFIITEIFPGGRIPTAKMMVEHGEKAGFVVPEYLSLQTHYVRTLRTWADTLEAKKDEVVAVTTEEVYDRYMRYLRGCQALLRRRDARLQPRHVPQARRRRLTLAPPVSGCSASRRGTPRGMRVAPACRSWCAG